LIAFFENDVIDVVDFGDEATGTAAVRRFFGWRGWVRRTAEKIAASEAIDLFRED
jgi:hypothetical protein